MSSLAALVAAAPGSLVAPEGDRRAELSAPTPLALEAALDLGAGRHVAVVRDAAGDRWTVPLVLDGDGLHRARPGDGVAAALVARADGDDGFAVRSWHLEHLTGERGVGVDQTNESVVVGERAVVKWVVRLPDLAGTEHPAVRRLALLADAGFGAVPPTWSLLTRSGDLLSVVDEYLPGAQDGWDWAVDDVRAFAAGDLTLAAASAPAGELGRLTGELHLALATGGVTRATAEDARGWALQAFADLMEALHVVTGAPAERLAARADRIGTELASMSDAKGSPQLDVHGDLHVGQWLRHGTPNAWRYAVTDFDGSPVAAHLERASQQPAARDVASMLASLDHVGRIVVHRTEDVDATAVRRWVTAAETTFLAAYRERAGHLLDERLLLPLRLLQECREHVYAARHLPLWSYVPDAALADLLPDEPPED